MDEIGKVLPALFQKQFRRTEPHILEILLPLWPRIAGKTMAQHSRPARFDAGVLTLAADCATWGTQLQLMTGEIRSQINSFVGQTIVKKVRIKTVNQPSLFSSPRPARVTAPRHPPLATPAVNTNDIADPDIALALASSYAKYFNRDRR